MRENATEQKVRDGKKLAGDQEILLALVVVLRPFVEGMCGEVNVPRLSHQNIVH
jgi:hypothetical protein